MIQEIRIFIWEKISSYNPEKGIKVFTFLEKPIIYKIYELLPSFKTCINISNYAWRKIKSFQKFMDTYEESHNGNLPSNKDLETLLGKNYQSMLNLTTNTFYFSAQNDDITFDNDHSQLTAPDNVLEYILKNEQSHTLIKCISKLEIPFAKTILHDYFYEDATIQEIATTLGLSKGRVSQIKKKAIYCLKEMEDLKSIA